MSRSGPAGQVPERGRHEVREAERAAPAEQVQQGVEAPRELLVDDPRQVGVAPAGVSRAISDREFRLMEDAARRSSAIAKLREKVGPMRRTLAQYDDQIAGQREMIAGLSMEVLRLTKEITDARRVEMRAQMRAGVEGSPEAAIQREIERARLDAEAQVAVALGDAEEVEGEARKRISDATKREECAKDRLDKIAADIAAARLREAAAARAEEAAKAEEELVRAREEECAVRERKTEADKQAIIGEGNIAQARADKTFAERQELEGFLVTQQRALRDAQARLAALRSKSAKPESAPQHPEGIGAGRAAAPERK